MNLDDLRRIGFDVRTRNHAHAVLTADFPTQLAELCHVLGTLRIDAEELVRGGGGEAQLTQRLRRSLTSRHWVKRNIVIRKIVDDEEREGTTHEIDHVRSAQSGSIALELEWNNKDPFFDRDLENFQRLHAEGVISVGVIVTRGASLQNNIRAIIREWAIACGIEGFLTLMSMVSSQRHDNEVSLNAPTRTLLPPGLTSSPVTSSVPQPHIGTNYSSGSIEALATRVPCCCSASLTRSFSKQAS